MRNRTALTLIIGLVFGISGAAYFSHAQKRAPASLSGGKLPWVPPPVGKHLALLKVEIAPPANLPETGVEDVELTGRILVNQNLHGDLTYQWNLPEDVQLVAGEQTDSLANVKMGQIVELKITVSGFNKEKQRLISLQASGLQGAETLGNSAIITSRPEDTWEASAAEIKKSADEQLGSGAKSRRGQ